MDCNKVKDLISQTKRETLTSIKRKMIQEQKAKASQNSSKGNINSNKRNH